MNSNGYQLGPLEVAVMEILWTHGEACVREVAEKLGRPLAYTTVMTTLDRLYKKNLLNRRKLERAFVYGPRLSRSEFDGARAGDWFASFLANEQLSGESLISCLVDAVGQQDEALLEELEKRVREKRQELTRGRKS
jgi:predicted transcriptional regulator